MTIAQRQTAQSASTLNPITAEIVRHALLSIPNQIDANIMRTAFSPLIYEYKDFAVGIVDAEGKLICQAKGGIPLFVANALGVAVRDGLTVHGADGIEDGDLLITNHAGTMGQHLNNVVMYTPIFAGPDKRDLFGFMAVLVHWIDIGGITVGSFLSSDTTSVFQEGIQYRSVKLWSRGKPQKDIYSIVQTNTRFPHMLMGDLESQIAGCLLGRTKVAEVIGKYGLDTVRASVEAMWDRSEASTRKALREIPDGTYEAESFIDNDGVELDRRVPVRVVVHVAGDEMTVDFSGVAEQARGPINSGREGGAVAAARIALKYLAMPDEPPNDGCFRPLHVLIPDGKFISAGADAPLGAYSTPAIMRPWACMPSRGATRMASSSRMSRRATAAGAPRSGMTAPDRSRRWSTVILATFPSRCRRHSIRCVSNGSASVKIRAVQASFAARPAWRRSRRRSVPAKLGFRSSEPGVRPGASWAAATGRGRKRIFFAPGRRRLRCSRALSSFRQAIA